MDVEQMKRTLDQIHREVLEVITEGRVDARSKRVLSKIANNAMALSQQLEVTPQDESLAGRFAALLSDVVSYFLGQSNGD